MLLGVLRAVNKDISCSEINCRNFSIKIKESENDALKYIEFDYEKIDWLIWSVLPFFVAQMSALSYGPRDGQGPKDIKKALEIMSDEDVDLVSQMFSSLGGGCRLDIGVEGLANVLNMLESEMVNDGIGLVSLPSMIANKLESCFPEHAEKEECKKELRDFDHVGSLNVDDFYRMSLRFFLVEDLGRIKRQLSRKRYDEIQSDKLGKSCCAIQ